jgi:hypothetical protein
MGRPIRTAFVPVFLISPTLARPAVTGAVAAGSTAKKLDIIRDDLDFGTVLTVLFPPVLTEFTVNSYLFSFYQVLIQGFTLPSPKDYVKKIRLVYPLIAGLTPAVNGKGKFTHRLPTSGIF